MAYRSPAVSHDPVVDAVLAAPADDGNGVRDVRRSGVDVSQNARPVVLCTTERRN